MYIHIRNCIAMVLTALDHCSNYGNFNHIQLYTYDAGKALDRKGWIERATRTEELKVVEVLYQSKHCIMNNTNTVQLKPLTLTPKRMNPMHEVLQHHD